MDGESSDNDRLRTAHEGCRDAGSTRGPASPDNTNIFVSGLHPDLVDRDLYALFHPFGDICSFEIVRDPRTGLSRGIGFVQFVQGTDVDAAVRRTNGVTYPFPRPSPTTAAGSFYTLRVRRAVIDSARTTHHYRTNKLFVRHVPLEMTQDALTNYFSRFGSVVSCVVSPDVSRRGIAEGTTLLMAYVTFSQPEEALAATMVEHSGPPLPQELVRRHGPLVVKLAETLERRKERYIAGNVLPDPPCLAAVSTPLASYPFGGGAPGAATAPLGVSVAGASVQPTPFLPQEAAVPHGLILSPYRDAPATAAHNPRAAFPGVASLPVGFHWHGPLMYQPSPMLNAGGAMVPSLSSLQPHVASLDPLIERQCPAVLVSSVPTRGGLLPYSPLTLPSYVCVSAVYV